MTPIKMMYQPTEKDKEMLVDVYAFHALPDYEGDYNHTMVTCWVPSNRTWLTAPVWCFIPFENKILKEG